MVKEEYSIIPNTKELPSAVAGLADIRFAGEVISLDVPRGGVTTKEGWSIFPTTSTTVRCKFVCRLYLMQVISVQWTAAYQ